MIRLITALALLAAPALAGPPQVLGATATRTGETWRIDVTIRHADTGWEHYADGWWVLSEDGTELGYRKLHHPHVQEQPFTRSLARVAIPDGAEAILIRPHDSVHGPGADYRLGL